MRAKQNRIIHFFPILAACLFILASNAAAAELQVGLAGVSVGESLRHEGTDTVMPMAAFQVNIAEHNDLKFEIGGFMYNLQKSGKGTGTPNNRILHDGDLEITGVSASAILVFPDLVKDVRLNIGAGAITCSYKSDLSSEADTDLALNSISNGEEDIATTTGIQIIMGADILLTDNLILGLNARIVNMRPKASFSADYPTGSAITKEEIDLSHEMLVLNLLYLFNF